MRMLMRMLLWCAVAVMFAACSSAKHTALAAGGSAAPSASTTTETAGGGSNSDARPTGSFCADARLGTVSSAMVDAADPTAASNSTEKLKKIDGEAPSEIKPALDTMLHLLTQVKDASTDAAQQAALTAAGPQLQTAAASIERYITARCG